MLSWKEICYNPSLYKSGLKVETVRMDKCKRKNVAKSKDKDAR